MSKKKKKDKKEFKEFLSMLKENQKKIFIMDGDEKISLNEAVDKTIAAITSVPSDSVIPVTPEEASKKRNVQKTVFESCYRRIEFTLYEYAMKYPTIPQTLVLTLDENEIVDLFDYAVNDTITALMERTNIGLILKKMDKAKNRIRKWLDHEPEEDFDLFVLNIPNVVLFTDVLKKKDVSKSAFFNITIQVVKTKKPLAKLKKKDKETYEKVVKEVIELTSKTAMNLGNSSIHIPVTNTFDVSLKEYGAAWCEAIIDKDAEKAINNVVFTSNNTTDFVELSNAILSEHERISTSGTAK